MICDDHFYLLLSKVSSNLIAFEEVIFENKNYIRELIEVIPKHKKMESLNESEESITEMIEEELSSGETEV